MAGTLAWAGKKAVTSDEASLTDGIAIGAWRKQ
jgi:hypothetical protein